MILNILLVLKLFSGFYNTLLTISSLLSAIEIVKKMWNTLSVREIPKNADKLIQMEIFFCITLWKGWFRLKRHWLKTLNVWYQVQSANSLTDTHLLISTAYRGNRQSVQTIEINRPENIKWILEVLQLYDVLQDALPTDTVQYPLFIKSKRPKICPNLRYALRFLMKQSHYKVLWLGDRHI